MESSQDIKKILIEKILQNFDYICKRFYPPYSIFYKSLKINSRPLVEENVSFNQSLQNNLSATNQFFDYSKTNIQKKWVDEPDILKNLWKYVIYYNSKTHKVYIIQNDLKDIKNSKIIQKINVPSVVKNVKIFASNDRLVLIWTRFSKFGFVKPRTDILIFDISKLPRVKLLAFYDIKWKFFDARLVWSKLYVISSYSFTELLSKICNRWWYYKKDLKKDLSEKIKKYKRDIREKLEDIVKNKSIYLYFSENWNLNLNWKIYPYKIWIKNIDVKNIFYIPADFSKIDILKFNVVWIFDIQNPKDNFNQYFFWWNLQGGQIHMTTKSLYLVNSYYFQYYWRCPPGLYCIMPVFRRWDFTLIHKLRLTWYNLDYINTAVIPGRPINQYSMDEDNQWYFRIFTRHYYPERATDLYVFDTWLKLVGKLTDIAPWEDFKSSRFMWDKVFLVTFKATDPLFVIDLKDPSKPKVLGKLKIPGYSLYLHPLYKFGNVRYLLWIWQEAKEVYWNWSLPRNIKIDLYEIDFNSYRGWYDLLFSWWKEVSYKQEMWSWGQKDKSYYLSGNKLIVYINKNCCNTDIKVFTDGKWNYKVVTIYKWMICRCFVPEKLVIKTSSSVKRVYFEKKNLTNWWNGNLLNIKISQLYSLVLGKEEKYKNWGSYTPVFNNPRVFVIRDDKFVKWKKYIYLPVYLTEDIKKEECYSVYRWLDNWRKLTDEKCYSYFVKKPYFIWVKILSIDKDEGIKVIWSKNFIDKLWKISQYEYRRQAHRVWYVDNFVFEINNLFYDIWDFSNEDLEKFIRF